MTMQRLWFLKFLQRVTRQKYIMGFPNSECCENPQNKNKELLLQCSSWAGWLKDATKAFKPHSRCCQVWDTLCGPAKTRSQKPKIQISSFLPGPQQFSKNFPNQAVPRRFRQKRWVQLHSTWPQLQAYSSSQYTHPPKPQPLWQCHICGVGQSLISTHLMKVVFVATISHGWQAAEGKHVPCLFLPQAYSHQHTQVPSIKGRISILQTTQIQAACSILILPSSSFWFWIHNIRIL